MNKTKIDWCDSTWNPVTGCLHGCEYCYARGIASRFGGHWDKNNSRHLGGNGTIHVLEDPMCNHTTGKNRNRPVHNIQAPYPYGFDPTLYKYRLDDYRDKKGRNIFVCSMADLFGEWVPDSWIGEVFDACDRAPQHNYLFLTKNPGRYEQYDVPSGNENMWYGVSITTTEDIKSASLLPLQCKRFISVDPLLEDIKPEGDALYNYVDWVIIGAETGRRVVPKREWIEGIVNECRKCGKPVFMKSSLADIWDEPLIQEFPERLKGANR